MRQTADAPSANMGKARARLQMALRVAGRPMVAYCLCASFLLVAYAATAIAMSSTKDWADTGPLALTQPALSQRLPGAINPDQALDDCFPAANRAADKRYKVVGGYVDGRPYYACYQVVAATGYVLDVKVVDGVGFPINDAGIFKRGGAWPWRGVATSTPGFVTGGAGLAVLLAFGWIYNRRQPERLLTATPWTRRPSVLWAVATVAPVIGWLAVALWPKVSWATRSRVLMQATLCYAGAFFVFAVANAAFVSDQWALAIYGFLTIGVAYDLAANPLWLRRVPMRMEATDAFDSVAIQRALDGVYALSQRQLPQGLHAKVAEIRKEILELLPHASEFPPGSRELFVVQQTATDYLPTSVETYLALPATYATTAVLPGGKTALQILADQLDLLDKKMDEIDDAVRHRDSERLLIHGRFLEDAFGSQSKELDLPQAGRD